MLVLCVFAGIHEVSEFNIDDGLLDFIVTSPLPQLSNYKKILLL